ncbi:Calcium-transporting ATPase 3 [Verticillium dahliae VDG2]|nr:Calcium-transporting ATPase 3 [Verticillium dahliae VDG2]
MSALGNELDFFPPYDPPPSIQPEQQQQDPLDPVTMHKTAPFPGFTALSEQVFVREAPVSDAPRPAGQPHTVMLYGWGDGTARNVQKYTDGYAALFPHARQIAVLSPIAKAMFNSAAARAVAMTPVVDTLGALDTDDDGNADADAILVEAMSNTGARWSRAMTIGTAAWFPWPFAVTQCLWGSFLTVNVLAGWCVGREAAGAFALRVTDDDAFETKDARRLYLYSKEDDLITSDDVEMYMAESRQKGYQLRAELFDGSGHVGHMRMHPEKYWKAIADAWAWANEEPKRG